MASDADVPYCAICIEPFINLLRRNDDPMTIVPDTLISPVIAGDVDRTTAPLPVLVVAPVPPFATAKVPDSVMVPDVLTGPPDVVNPVEPPETWMLVTVPVPGASAQVPSPRKKVLADGVPVTGFDAGAVTDESKTPYAGNVTPPRTGVTNTADVSVPLFDSTFEPVPVLEVTPVPPDVTGKAAARDSVPACVSDNDVTPLIVT